MPYIQVHTGAIRNVKIKSLSQKLNLTRVQTLGHLTVLWCNILDLREDGDITSFTSEHVAEYAEYLGDVDFLQALKDVGLLDVKRGRVLVHDWMDYAGKYLYMKYHQNKPSLLKKIAKLHNYKVESRGYSYKYKTLDEALADPQIRDKAISINRHIDWNAECRKMKTWVKMNPSKAPKGNYKNFITNWINRIKYQGESPAHRRKLN